MTDDAVVFCGGLLLYAPMIALLVLVGRAGAEPDELGREYLRLRDELRHKKGGGP